MKNKAKSCERVLRAMIEHFEFKIEPFEESINRQTGKTGTFYGRRVRGASGKLLLELGGCETQEIANWSVLQMIIIMLAEYISKTSQIPPELNRKDWLRSNVIKGGKDQPS